MRPLKRTDKHQRPKDFAFTDEKNQTVHLKSFAGKVIFIDLWVTWCGPCIAELPYLDSLKLRYKNNPDIVFIALSIDDNKAAWQKNISARNAAGIQGIIDRVKLNDYRVASVPRTIIVNKDFTVAAINGPSPSDKKAGKILDDLLQ